MRLSTPFLRQALVALGLFAAFNLLLWASEGRTVVFSRMQRVQAGAPGADVVAIGSSIVEAGIDPKAFRKDVDGRSPRNLLNAGIGAATGVERSLVARSAARWVHPGTLFVVGFMKNELMDLRFSPPGQQPWWTHLGNMSMGFHFEQGTAADLYSGGVPWKRLAFRLFGSVPVLTERGATWGRVEQLRRRAEDLGLPPVAENRFGRVRDFGRLDVAEVAKLEQQTRQCLEVADPLDSVTRGMLSDLRKAGSPVVLLVMPMATTLRERYYGSTAWKAYLELLGVVLTADFQGRLLDASDWIPDEPQLWFDPEHLSAAGADVFSRRLALELAAGKTTTVPKQRTGTP